MDEVQFTGVQQQARCGIANLCLAIETVAEDGVAKLHEMDTQLVCPSGERD